LGPESNYAVKRIMHLSDMHLSGVHCTSVMHGFSISINVHCMTLLRNEHNDIEQQWIFTQLLATDNFRLSHNFFTTDLQSTCRQMFWLPSPISCSAWNRNV